MVVVVDHHRRPGGGSGPKSGALNHRCHLRSLTDPAIFSLPPDPLLRTCSTPSLFSSAPPNDKIAAVTIIGGRAAPGVLPLVADAAAAVALGGRLIPAATGLGGAFLLRGPAGDCLAVVKPFAGAGETGVREAAAYLLDHAAFAGVPATALVRIAPHAFPPASRLASIQRFVPHDFDSGGLGPSRFSVASIHRIGVLDVRLLNTDRHAGNLLVRNPTSGEGCSFDEGDIATRLVPIDHGLCLPEQLEDPYFEWLHWPQAAAPFSGEEAEYVSKLDPFEDAELLRAELPSIREPAIRILVLCTVFLKKAVDSGLRLSEIGGMMTREFCGVRAGESALEALCKEAEEAIEAESRYSEVGEEDEWLLKRYLGHLSEEEERGRGMRKKSMSFSAGEVNGDGGGVERSKVISFESKSEEEWMLFLERFEQLLPEAFEARKMIEMKPRLGSSCNF